MHATRPTVRSNLGSSEGRTAPGIHRTRAVRRSNGDGIGDQVHISFDLLKVLAPRPVELSVYSLAGNRIALVAAENISAGHIELTWDGRGDNGHLVPPGIYLLSLQITGDALAQTENRLVSVVY